MQAKAAAEAAAAIHKDNTNATDIFISGFEGPNSVINGLYSPTHEKGQDGRVLYRKSDEFDLDDELCIDHFGGEWRVTNKWGREDGACLAFCKGGCALEKCRSRVWKAFDGEDFVGQPSVQMVTEGEVKSRASGRAVILHQSTLVPCRLSYHVFDADELCRPRLLLKQLLLFARTTRRPPTSSSVASKASIP